MNLTTYRFHWKGASTPAVVGAGTSPEDAFNRLGYGVGASLALDYFEVVKTFEKMPLETFIQWEVDYWKRAESRHLRLGQAFLNQNYPDEVNSGLYEEKDPLICRRIILEVYVDTRVEGEKHET